MLDVKALRFRVLRIVVRPVRDDDLVVGNAGIAEVLRLSSALVPEAASHRQLVNYPGSPHESPTYPRNKMVLSFKRSRFASESW